MRRMTGRGLLAGVILLFAFTSGAGAQDSRVGIKGGLNLSLLTVEDVDENKLKGGFHAGFFIRRMLSDNLALQPELIYTIKGVRTVYNEEFLGFQVADGKTMHNLHYLEIPIYFSAEFLKIVDIHVGPYFGFLMNAKVETQAEVLEFIEIDDQDHIGREEFHILDAGVSGGVGVTLRPFTFGINYSLGLRPVAEAGEPMEPLLGRAVNHTLMGYVGLVF